MWAAESKLKLLKSTNRYSVEANTLRPHQIGNINRPLTFTVVTISGFQSIHNRRMKPFSNCAKFSSFQFSSHNIIIKYEYLSIYLQQQLQDHWWEPSPSLTAAGLYPYSLGKSTSHTKSYWGTGSVGSPSNVRSTKARWKGGEFLGMFNLYMAFNDFIHRPFIGELSRSGTQAGRGTNPKHFSILHRCMAVPSTSLQVLWLLWKGLRRI